MKIFSLLTFLLFISQCESDKIPSETLSRAECALSYDLNESLFTDEDTLVFGINLVYFMNEGTVEYTKEQVDRTFEQASYFFNNAKIKFKVLTVNNIKGGPTENLQVSKSIKNKITRFDIENYQFFSMMLNEPHVINVYVYNEPESTSFAGVAGGIGSDYLAIRKDYFDVPARTLVHELGHCLSLYHTHQPDETDGYNIFDGDKVCDTPAGRSLSGLVNRECELNSARDSVADSLQRINLMSYSYPFCRKEFTEGQVKKMRWYIEQSPQAQSMLINRHELINRKIEDIWIDL